MSISRLTGLNVAQGLEKAHLSYKQAQLKLLDGRIAKVEVYTNKLLDENKSAKQANSQWLELSDERSKLKSEIGEIKESRALRNEDIKETRQIIYSKITDMREDVAKIAMKIQMKANSVKQQKTGKAIHDIEVKIKDCDSRIQFSKGLISQGLDYHQANLDKAIKEKEALLVKKFKLESSEYQSISANLEHQKKQLDVFEKQGLNIFQSERDLATLEENENLTPAESAKIQEDKTKLKEDFAKWGDDLGNTYRKIGELEGQIKPFEDSFTQRAHSEVFTKPHDLHE